MNNTFLVMALMALGAAVPAASSPSASPLAGTIPAASAPADTSPYGRIGLDQKLGAEVDLSSPFRDERGSPITLAQVAAGRPILLVLAYYRCPMLCTYVLTGLARGLGDVSLKPGRDYRVAAVSIDPREGPDLAAAKKRTYLSRIGSDPGAAEGWRFLTGDQPAIRALADSVGFRYAYDKATGDYAHPAAVIALTPQGRVSRYFPGVEFPSRDLRLGLVEASKGKLGGLSDRVFLACSRYNPVTGRYSLSVAKAMRFLGIGLVLVLLSAATALERKGRRRARYRERETPRAAAHGV